MATIFKVYENAKRANEVAKGVVVGIIEGHSDIITDLNKEQLKHGIDFVGEKISPFYGSLMYALEKNEKNPLAGMGVPDLYYTGAFYGGFFLSINGMAFEIDSSDNKRNDLVEKYTENIFGLSGSSLEIYTKNYFFEEFKEFIENTLKLKMQ